MQKIGRYDYEELRAAAVAPGAKQEDLAALVAWFEEYDWRDWNGESWDLDDGLELWPVYGEEDEDGNTPIVGYEIR